MKEDVNDCYVGIDISNVNPNKNGIGITPTPRLVSSLPDELYDILHAEVENRSSIAIGVITGSLTTPSRRSQRPSTHGTTVSQGDSSWQAVAAAVWLWLEHQGLSGAITY
jgi:hypothetical protein